MSVNIVDKSTGNLIKVAGNVNPVASSISYDNTTSHMTATNTQAAIDELKNTLTAQLVTFTPASGVTISMKTIYKCSNILLGTLWIDVPSTRISASSELGSFNVTLANDFRTIGIATSSSIRGQIGHFRFIPSGKLYVDNNYALPAAGEYKLDITVPLSS